MLADSAHTPTPDSSAFLSALVSLRLRLALLTLIVVLAAGWAPACANADGDPASDVLVTQPLFLPFDAAVSSRRQAQIAGLLQGAAKGGYQLRVAVIVSPADLGSVGELWRRPQAYAEFLGDELSLVYRGTLLVVMPNGLGIYREGGSLGAERGALANVPAPGDGDRLAATALMAIERVAAAAGHPLALPSATPAPVTVPGRPETVSWVVFALSGVLVAAAWTASLRAKAPRVRGRFAALRWP
jgi:hypothetical protein